MRITFTSEAASVLASSTEAPDSRILTGLALPFGVPGRTSAGTVRASAGVITWSADLRRIKVFRGHDRTRPVGYVTALTEADSGLEASFYLGRTDEGSAALLEATEGISDGLSVELDEVVMAEDGRITSATLTGIALVPTPAFTDARLAAEDTEPEPDPVIASPEAISDDEPDDEPDEEEEHVDTDTDAPEVQAAAAPPALIASRGKTARATRLTLEQATAQVAAAFRESDRSAHALNAALADITPVTTNWAAVQPYQWVGELWTPVYQALDWANSITSGTLTSMKIVGWKRDTSKNPTIKPYAGNKAEIGTDANLAFLPAEETAKRHAVGVDFDRIFLDFGDESVIQTWLQLVSQSYAQVLDDAIGTLILAEATDGGTAPDMISGVTVAARKLKTVGARVSWVAVASDLWSDFLAIPAAEAPWWLASSSSVDIGGDVDSNKSASINTLPRVFESPALDDGTIVAGDKRAATQYTPRGNPFQVRAVDLPRGGIDVAVFGYSAEMVNDPLGIVKVTVGAITP